MKASFDVLKAVGGDVDDGSRAGGVSVVVVTPKVLSSAQRASTAAPWGRVGRSSGSSTLPDLPAVVDAMGEGSASAQGLGAVITTTAKMVASGGHRLYLAVAPDRATVLGLLKVGTKHLFIRVRAAGRRGRVWGKCHASPRRVSVQVCVDVDVDVDVAGGVYACGWVWVGVCVRTTEGT